MSHDPEITTILGKGSSFDGKLTFEGTVRIDGTFSGEIRTEGTLIIGESAEVNAEVIAGSIVVQGVVRGDLSGRDSIEIHAPARVYGNVASPSLEIQKGSVFEGNARMEELSTPGKRTNGRASREAPPANSEPVAEA